MEDTPEQFVANLVAVFREVRRALRPDGLCWLNLGDSYNAYNGNRGKSTSFSAATEDACPVLPPGNGLTVKSCKQKDLLMIPAQVAIALRDDGWYLRQEIVLTKLAPMPESVRDRPTRACEKLFMLAKEPRYYYDADAERVASTATPQRRLTPHGVGRGDARQNGVTEPRDDPEPDCNPNGRNLWDYWDDDPEDIPPGSWEWAPEPSKLKHYAAFPTWLPRRCLRLGSSLKGCCPACGSPWRRVVERQKRTRQRPNEYVKRTGEEGTGNSCANTVAGVSVTTRGWAPSCGCPVHEPVPCVTLDPFTGSGTTGAVARDLGMRFLGVDLNPEYAAMARRRIGSANPLLDACDVAAVAPTQQQPDLFP